MGHPRDENSPDPFGRYFGSGHSSDDEATQPVRRPPGPPRPSRPTWRRRPVVTTLAALSTIVLVATGVMWGVTGYAMAKVERVPAFAGLSDRPEPSPGINILLVGSDRREGLSEEMLRKLNLGHAAGQRSDTMILAHISADHNRAVLVSLPRDWYVTIPAHRTESGERVEARKAKLNAAYSLGGANLTVATVEHATGIRIDHYVEVNFLGFVQVVNALGGVDVCVPTEIHDKKSGLTLSAGKHHLNGVQSLRYVRSRYGFPGGSDLSRIDRQQKFLGAMMQQALSTGTLLNPFKFSSFLNAALEAVRVDKKLSSADIRRLALVMRDLDPHRVRFLTVPVAASSLGDSTPGIAVSEKASTLFRQIRQDKRVGGPRKKANKQDRDGEKQAPRVTIPPSNIEIEVYNDTNIDGLGARATEDLREVGFLIEAPARNADPPNNATRTVIQYGPNRGDSARTLAAALPQAELKKIPALGDDIQVVVGSSYDGAQEVQVDAGGGGSDDSKNDGKKFNTRSAAAGVCSNVGKR